MAGQLIERGRDRYLIRVYLGRDETGKRRYLNRTVHGKKKEAQQELTRLLREKDEGRALRPSRETLGQYLDRWLAVSVAPRVRPRTLSDYRSLLTRYVRPTLGAVRLDRLTPFLLQTLYRDLTTKGLSPRTVRYVHAVLHSALTQAVRWQLLARNPASDLDLPAQEKPRRRPLSRQELERLLHVAKEEELYPLYLLAATAGLRPSEYRALRWEDVDLDKGTLCVRRTLSPDGRVQEPKTDSSSRVVRMLPTVVSALRSHRTSQKELRLAHGPDFTDEGWVFTREDGRPLSLSLVRQRFKSLLKRAGLPPEVRLYDLRGTAATLLLDAGVHPKVASEMLGHSTITLTMDIYTHSLPHIQEEAALKVEGMLFGG
jgi:integrase